MEVTFTRTGPRRYAVRADRPGFPTVEMNPAPGYDPYLPHDLIHFVVEAELGLPLGVFGQLAAGGDAGSFYLPPNQLGSRERSRSQRRTKRRGGALLRAGRRDAERSEQAASICQYEWLRRSSHSELRAKARIMAPYIRTLSSAFDGDLLSRDAIDRICKRLDVVSAEWRQLSEGGSLTVTWVGASFKHELHALRVMRRDDGQADSDRHSPSLVGLPQRPTASSRGRMSM